MDAYTIAILVSLLIYLFVGNYAGRKVKGLDDYFVAGRRAPTVLIIGTLVASAVGTNSFLGETGFTFDGNAMALIATLPFTVVGYVIGGLFFGRYLRRSKALTVAEFFGARFSSDRVRRFAAMTVIIGLGGYLMTVTQGSALIVSQVTDFSYSQALILVWLGYSVFTVYAGSRGVVITDTLMFLLFTVVAFFALSYIVGAAGGWFASIEALATSTSRPGIISAGGYTGDNAIFTSTADQWTWSIVIGLAWGTVFAVGPWQSSRYLMARDEHVVIRSSCITACILIVLWTVLEFSGAAIALSNIDIEPSAQAMIWAALNLMPVLAGSVLLAGIVSAGLSSASTFLTLVGFAITNDIVIDATADDATKLRWSRLTILMVGVVALALALILPPSIFWITFFVGPMFASAWGPVAFMSVWSKRITEAGAFWGMVAGFFGCVIPKALDVVGLVDFPTYLDPIILGAVASLTTIFALSRKDGATATEQAFIKQIHTAPPELSDLKKVRATLIWPKLMIVWGLLLIVGLIVVFVHPYQVATGLTSAQGSYIVMSGELLFAIGFGLVISSGGLIAYCVVKRLLP